MFFFPWRKITKTGIILLTTYLNYHPYNYWKLILSLILWIFSQCWQYTNQDIGFSSQYHCYNHKYRNLRFQQNSSLHQQSTSTYLWRYNCKLYLNINNEYQTFPGQVKHKSKERGITWDFEDTFCTAFLLFVPETWLARSARMLSKDHNIKDPRASTECWLIQSTDVL